LTFERKAVTFASHLHKEKDQVENQDHDIRKPAVAGTFYPSNPVELTKTIAGFYADVDKVTLGGRPMGLIAPHSGYPYSGKIAAKAFKLLEGEHFDTVVIVSPSHTVFFQGSSIYGGAGYQTPIGVIETDIALAQKIAAINPSAVYFSNMGHSSGTARGEHSLEVQLPFLQIVLGKFKLVAIVMGDQDPDSGRLLGETLAAALKGTNTLLVASTDLSHFHAEKEARRLDFAVQDAIEKYDTQLLIDTLDSGRGEACGGGAVASVMLASKRLGGSTVKFLDYGTSGSVTGDFDDVVGYMSAAIVSGRPPVMEKTILGAIPLRIKEAKDLTSEDKRQIREIARMAIETRADGKSFVPPLSERLNVQFGLFMRVHVDDSVHLPYGRIRPEGTILHASAEIAQLAAFEDPRYDPLAPEQLQSYGLDIYVLSKLERLREFDDIKIGRDGLMVKLDMHSALMLPVEAADKSWTAGEFFEQVCLKAGLPRGAYKERYAEVYKFTTEVC